MLRTKLEPLGGCGIKYYTVTINPSPSNSTVVFTYQGQNYYQKSIRVKKGSNLSYTVSCSGYYSSSNTIYNIASDQTKNISLSLIPTCAYTSGQVVMIGTDSATLKENGYYSVEIVGAGADGYYVNATVAGGGYYFAGGGSGAGFVGRIYLSAGSYRSVQGSRSGGSSTFSGPGGSITAGGGTKGSGNSIIGSVTAGKGGKLIISSISYSSYSVNSNGNKGGASRAGNVSGGASVYNGYGKGGGSASSTREASDGYFRLRWYGYSG